MALKDQIESATQEYFAEWIQWCSELALVSLVFKAQPLAINWRVASSEDFASAVNAFLPESKSIHIGAYGSQRVGTFVLTSLIGSVPVLKVALSRPEAANGSSAIDWVDFLYHDSTKEIRKSLDTVGAQYNLGKYDNIDESYPFSIRFGDREMRLVDKLPLHSCINDLATADREIFTLRYLRHLKDES